MHEVLHKQPSLNHRSARVAFVEAKDMKLRRTMSAASSGTSCGFAISWGMSGGLPVEGVRLEIVVTVELSLDLHPVADQAIGEQRELVLHRQGLQAQNAFVNG